MTDELPTVHQAVNAVMREITNLGKSRENKHFGFKFRGIDDLLGAIAAPLRNHGVFIAPRLKSVDSEVIGKSVRTVVEMEYDIYGPRGDYFTVCYPGEAADTGDKSVGKACSYALKMMCFALFAIPIDAGSADDPDSEGHALDYSQRRGFQTRAARADDTRPPARPAQAIAEDALKATDPAQMKRLYFEAKNGGRLNDTVTPPPDAPADAEPMPLGKVLWDLKTQLEAAA